MSGTASRGSIIRNSYTDSGARSLDRRAWLYMQEEGGKGWDCVKIKILQNMSDVFFFKVTCISLFKIASSNLNDSCVRNELEEKSKKSLQ